MSVGGSERGGVDVTAATAARADADLRRLRRYTWWSLMVTIVTFALAQLLVVVVAAVSSPAAPLPVVVRAAVLIVLTVLCAGMLCAIVPELTRPPDVRRVSPTLVAVAAVTGALVWFLANLTPSLAWGGALSLASVATVVLSAARGALRIPATLAVVTTFVLLRIAAMGVDGQDMSWAQLLREDDVPMFVAVLIVPGATIAGVWALDVASDVDRARLLTAELAVTEERLRFANDLHDIQGHHLQVIALKAELAERLMLADPVTAGREMGEVRRLAATALDDTRSLVSGYRGVSLRTEIQNAAAVLSSAGATTRVHDLGAAELAADTDTVIGIAVREGTTNILRHSLATEVGMSITRDAGTVRLQIRNDGVRPRTDAAGSGLRGLRERVTALGGTVDTTQQDDVFTLVVRVPERDDA